jgi:hypothetical protein
LLLYSSFLFLLAAVLQAGKNCLKGFSVQGRIEKARRNYTQMWEQIGSYRKKEGAEALSNFRLNILGEVVEYFAVPGKCPTWLSCPHTPHTARAHTALIPHFVSTRRLLPAAGST